ncbi:hypothetical protein SYNPS1DRAFT_9387, partial [Syncephalis pseudoplumigaleata]
MGWFVKEFTAEQVPDLTGKVAVVTGANTGIGYELALQLARRGCKVYAACRNEERAVAAIARIKATLAGSMPEPDVRFLALDLNKLSNVDATAKTLMAAEPQIHILVNNAGVMAMPYSMTDDNIESHFGVNHRLLPVLRRSGTPDDPARVVFTSSLGHYGTYLGGIRLTLDDVNSKRYYSSMMAYGHSKLANIMTASYLARQEPRTDGRPTVLINSVHPGVVRSELGRNV